MGRIEWESGSLSSTELSSVLCSALADLWADSWRRNQTNAERMRLFKRRVEMQLYFATGHDLVIRYPNERG